MSDKNIAAEIIARASIDTSNFTAETLPAELVRAADGLDDKDYNLMSPQAQKWANGGALAMNAGETLPDIDLTGIDFEAADKPETPAPPAPKTSKKASKKKATAKKTTRSEAATAPLEKEEVHRDPPAAKTGPPALSVADKRRRNVLGVGTVSHTVMRILLNSKFSMSVSEAAIAARDELGHNVSIITAESSYAQLARALDVMRSAGLTTPAANEIISNLEAIHARGGA